MPELWILASVLAVLDGLYLLKENLWEEALVLFSVAWAIWFFGTRPFLGVRIQHKK